MFFWINCPNYAHYCTLFLHLLQTACLELTSILKSGAFLIRRTLKKFSRSAVDVSLEQSYNRDAASAMKGLVAFRNSEGAVRHWALTRSQTTIAVTELRSIFGLEHNENVSFQVFEYLIRKDYEHMHVVALSIEDFGSLFAYEFEVQSLMNLASGKSALPNPSKYLLEMPKRGKEAQENFIEESRNDPN